MKFSEDIVKVCSKSLGPSMRVMKDLAKNSEPSGNFKKKKKKIDNFSGPLFKIFDPPKNFAKPLKIKFFSKKLSIVYSLEIL